MRTIYVATRNQHKLEEIRTCLSDLPVRFEALPDDAPEVIEDGSSFAANSIKKAVSARDHTGEWAIADDSGLEVDALDGAPGIYSARFAGVDGGDADSANNRKLLADLDGIPAEKRTARFRCVIALARPGRESCPTFDGVIEGEILFAPRGNEGFGYDPLFLYPPFGCTLAEVPLSKKNSVSHRANALMKLRVELSAELLA